MLCLIFQIESVGKGRFSLLVKRNHVLILEMEEVSFVSRSTLKVGILEQRKIGGPNYDWIKNLMNISELIDSAEFSNKAPKKPVQRLVQFSKLDKFCLPTGIELIVLSSNRGPIE